MLEPKRKCKLEWTVEDHKLAGSSPPPELANNPGKRQVDTMTDGDVKELLEFQKAELDRLQKKALVTPNFDVTQSGIRYKRATEERERTLKFLERIGRLPKTSPRLARNF